MPGKHTITVQGVEIEVVSEDEAEKSDWFVCMPWKGVHYFDDDAMGHCTVCGIEVRYRPSAPKKPPRICLKCASEKTAHEQ